MCIITGLENAITAQILLRLLAWSAMAGSVKTSSGIAINLLPVCIARSLLSTRDFSLCVCVCVLLHKQLQLTLRKKLRQIKGR